MAAVHISGMLWKNNVYVHSLEENNFVGTLIKNFAPHKGDTQIWLHDAFKKGWWIGSDGSGVSFTSLVTRQPDNAPNEEDCGVINFSVQSKMNYIGIVI